MLAAWLGPVGRPIHVRLRRRLLFESGGDATRRRPEFGPAAGGGICSEPEPEPWSAAEAGCPVARLARAVGGSGALVA